MKMPTIKQLLEQVEHEGYIGCAYGQSRAVLNHLHKPVLAYALGLGAFIAVYQKHNKITQAVWYGINRRTFGLSTLPVGQALDTIRTSKLAKHKKINKKALKEALQTQQYQRPTIGSVTIKHKHKTRNPYNSYERAYIIEQYKNKKYRAVAHHTWGDRQVPLQTFIDDLDKQDTDYKITITKNTTPPEVMEAIRARVLAEKI